MHEALSPQQDVGKIEPDLRQAMRESEPDERLRFIVRLKQEVAPGSWGNGTTANRHELVSRLRSVAAESQTKLLGQMRLLSAAGSVSNIRDLWIINAVAAAGSADSIRLLSGLDEVSRIVLDNSHRYFDPVAEGIDLERLAVASEPMPGEIWGIQRVRAREVWHGLGIDGSGVTLAIMDSGVDWRHPGLFDNYRGNLGGGRIDHDASWFNATVPTSTEPVDPLGHGTHVAGTAVGQTGTGMAPGASWIAVGITDESGNIYDSSVHLGFQWLLAPGGDPSMAPDIINGSWGGAPATTTFVEDIELLHAAGIITVFSAGNAGPLDTSINSPGSYTGTIAVGASDEFDDVTWFSSRGPSPLTQEVKPWLVAPGTNVLSTLPSGQYGYANGTSMSAPHLAGAIALLRSAAPALSRAEIQQALARSSHRISHPTPNESSGWGRLDAYRLVAPYVQAGTIAARVRSGTTPISSAAVTITLPSGEAIGFETDQSGEVRAALLPRVYTLTVAHFGYMPVTDVPVSITAGQTNTVEVALTPLPSGQVMGRVLEAGTHLPVISQVGFAGTPVIVDTDENGHFQVSLPAGRYELEIRALGHRIVRSGINVDSGQVTTQTLFLPESPDLLLVDSGQWYYDSYADTYASALTESKYAYDLWTVKNPYDDVPTASELQAYDVVIWSSPQDSPGFLGADLVITDFLGGGGNLLVSGQEVGRLDGSGFYPAYWYYQKLQADYGGEAAVTQTILGSPSSPFEGLSLKLNGNDSADNQVSPELSRPRIGSLTAPSFAFAGGGYAGLTAGLCQPYRIVYLGFGIEGVADGANRAAILDRSMKFFSSAPTRSGAQWREGTLFDYALPGSTINYTFTLRNLSETAAESFDLEVSGAEWPISLSRSRLDVESCEDGVVVLTLTVPDDAQNDEQHQMQIIAHSTEQPGATAVVTLSHKTPGTTLLVDDDRWYNQELIYQSALDQAGIQYDVWDIGWDEDVRGSPSQALLNAYDFVIWYTGYDWYAPVTAAERETLTGFLEQGGRLFLSSQDFMYYAQHSELAKEYFGVVEYAESVTPTMLIAADRTLLPSSFLGNHSLDYGPYQNFSDGLVAGPDGIPFVWHDQGMAAGLANSGPGWRALFLAIPFETLPKSAHAEAMAAAVGWLGDLGDSSFEVDQRNTLPGESRRFSITLRNASTGDGNRVWITNSLPVGLEIQMNSLTTGMVYDSAARALTWRGNLGSGMSTTISYLATPDATLVSGTKLENQLTIWYEKHRLPLKRSAAIWIDVADLSASAFEAKLISAGTIQTFTYALILSNTGTSAATDLTSAMRLPEGLEPVAGSLRVGGGTAALVDRRLDWTGSLDVAETITVSLALTRPVALSPIWLPATAIIDDGKSDPIVLSTQPSARPFEWFLPLAARP